MRLEEYAACGSRGAAAGMGSVYRLRGVGRVMSRRMLYVLVAVLLICGVAPTHFLARRSDQSVDPEFGPAAEPNGLRLASGPLAEPNGLCFGPNAEPHGVQRAFGPAAEPHGLRPAFGPNAEPNGLRLAVGPDAKPTRFQLT